MSNDRNGHDKLVAPAREMDAMVGFEAAGGARSARAGETRPGGHPPGRIRRRRLACGHMAKSDQCDAKGIASFMQNFPDAGRELPSAAPRELRVHVAMRAWTVGTGKKMKNGIQPETGRVRRTCSTTRPVRGGNRMTAGSPVSRRKNRRIVASDAILRRMAVDPSAICGVGFVATAAPIVEMPEPVPLSGRKDAVLIGLAPYARADGKKGQARHRRRKGSLADDSCQAAKSAMKRNPAPEAFAKRSRTRESPARLSSSRWRASRPSSPPR